jgi:uncharacterized protein
MTTTMRRLYHSNLLLSGVILLSACGTTGIQDSSYEQDAKAAKTYMQQGQPKKAARVYQHLADNETDLQDQFRLLAIESMILSGDINTAKTYAQAINVRQLSAQQQSLLNLYQAQIDLSFGEAEQATVRLEQIRPELLPDNDLIKFYQSNAFAYSLTGDLIKSASSRIALGPLLPPDQQAKNNSAILEALNLVPLNTLQETQARSSGYLTGWLSLARLVRQDSQNRVQLQNDFVQWQKAFPGHPANDLLPQILANMQNLPGIIAIILPGSGTYAMAGKAVREGVMAAYHQDTSTTKPELRFYDSEQSSAAALYNQAKAEGAQLVIGPLSKPDIIELAGAANLEIPVLALNNVPEIVRDNLYQFGLNPFDDTEQVSAKAWSDGHKNALLLIPETEQGARIQGFFQQLWESGHTALLETQSYDPKQTDFSEPLKKLLNLDESIDRFEKLRQLVPDITFTPRVRHDADLVLLNAYETAARSINPQLKYLQAAHFPVYATPQVYTGIPNPSSDIDLEDIVFCDTPWLFEDAYPGPLSFSALENVRESFPPIYLRLIAMGIDAYHLITQLDHLAIEPFKGASGNLTLIEGNRIKRNLVCAQFNQGQPIPSGIVNSSPIQSTDLPSAPENIAIE